MSELELRAAICEVGRRLWHAGLVGGTEGNITCRFGKDRLLCTPSGVSKGHLRPNEIVTIDLKGNPVGGSAAPSSEIGLHLACYDERPDCNAVVHAHPPVATAFGLAGRDIPDNVLPEAATVLGSVVRIGFAMPGTDQVAQTVRPHLASAKTFVLSNHGAFVLGKDVHDAGHRMETLERIAVLVETAERLGGAVPLPKAAFDELLKTSLHGRLD